MFSFGSENNYYMILSFDSAIQLSYDTYLSYSMVLLVKYLEKLSYKAF